MKKINVLVVGCGNMGASHAQAYHIDPNFEIVGLVARGESKDLLNEKMNSAYATFSDYAEA
mgnify:FL=1